MSNVTHITQRMSRQAFLKQREQARTIGFEFVLPDATILNDGEPFMVRIRRISMDEKAAVNGISQTMQDEVYRRTRKLATWLGEQQKKASTVEQQLDAVQNDETLVRAVNAVFWAAMIDPPIVEREEDLETNPDAWHIEDFSVADRFSVFRAATDDDSKEAKSLKLFRPESTDDVAGFGAMQAAEAPERDSGLAEEGRE
jgi:hypothetical protein